MIAKLLLAKLLATCYLVLGDENCRCFGQHSILCMGRLTGDESCAEARHMTLLDGVNEAFPSNWNDLLPNLQRIDVEGFQSACQQASSLPVIVVCHPKPIVTQSFIQPEKIIDEPDLEDLVIEQRMENGVIELRAMVGLSILSLLSQLLLLYGAFQLFKLIKPALSIFTSNAS